MVKLLEEFDGEPTFTLENEIIYQKLQTTGATGLAISKPRMLGEDVRRSALELIQAHGGRHSSLRPSVPAWPARCATTKFNTSGGRLAARYWNSERDPTEGPLSI